MMEDPADFNRARWEGLVRAGCRFTLPWMDLTPEVARQRVDEEGLLGELAGREVLCLAGGGGQQSVAFAMLGARVTVVDITEGQLEADRRAAAHYGVEVRTIRTDMRDLSMLDDGSFDIVYHAHSLVFVPDCQTVFREVRRILRPGGWYRMSYVNPYTHTVWDEHWNGAGYVIDGSQFYGDGEVHCEDECWGVVGQDGVRREVPGPREFRHRLSTVVNTLADLGFVLVRLNERDGADLDTTGPEPADPEPGSWAHFCRVVPPWLATWWRLGT